MARGKPKKKKIRLSRRAVATAEASHYGFEPTWEDVDSIPEDRIDITWLNTSNWYNAVADKKDFKTWILDYLKSSENETDKKLHSHIKTLPESYFTSDRHTAQIARVLTLGGGVLIPEAHLKKFKEKLKDHARKSVRRAHKIAEAKAAEADGTATDKSTGQNPQVYMQRSADAILETVEPLLDELYSDPNEKELDLYSIFTQDETKGKIVSLVSAEILRRLDEIKDEKSDEYYDYLSKSNKKHLIKKLQGLLDDCERQKTATKKTRVRKKAVPRKTNLLKTFKVKESDDEFKIVGVSTTKIIGADSAYFFNTKTKKLIAIYALDRGGLSVRGSKVINFDPVKSVEVTLRKPLEALAGIKAGKKRAIANLIAALTTKPKVSTGKINAQCVLVKVLS